MSKLAEVMAKVVELNARLRKLDEEIGELRKRARRSKRAAERLREVEEERLRLAGELSGVDELWWIDEGRALSECIDYCIRSCRDEECRRGCEEVCLEDDWDTGE